jgi:transcriptional regulator with XRE-family HTH domain
MMGYPKQPNREGFGETLRAQRKRAGLTMGDLARKTGLSLVTVSDIERGRDGSYEDMRAFIGALGHEPKAEAIMNACAELAAATPKESTDK